MEIGEYVEEYKRLRTALGRKNSVTGDECATLYAIYRKDLREGPRKATLQSHSSNGTLASAKTVTWLKDLRKAGKITISDEKLETITQSEASLILKPFERK